MEWNDVNKKLPEQSAELYLVVQKVEEQRTVGFAYYQQDGNGEWAFNKSDVTHWAKSPALPSETIEQKPVSNMVAPWQQLETGRKSR